MKEIFSQDDLDFVSNLIDTHNHILMENEDYKKLNDKIFDISEQIEKLPENVKNLFRDYHFNLQQSYNYEFSLLYNLGLKKGFEIKEIK